MAKVGRNDPCPCGSGRKYKKCHGQSNVIEFPTKLVEEELDQQFLKFQDFMYDQYPHLFPRSKPASDEEEVEQFIRLLYKGLFDVQKGGATIYQQFLHKNEPSIRRPATMEALRTWGETRASIFKFIRYDGKSVVEVEDLLYGGSYTVDRQRIPLEKKDFNMAPYFTGLLLNYGPIFKFAPMAVPVEENAYLNIREVLEEEFKEQSKYSSLRDYFHATFLEQVPLWVYYEEGSLDDSGNVSSTELEVLEILNQHLEPEFKEKESFQNLKEIWMHFCKENSPVIRKPEVFAASLEYYLKSSPYFLDGGNASKREVAEKYKVSPNSISKRHLELDHYYSNKV
ncbi:YecA family protein [Halobacillus sp. A5]|uniref:YecA family protein n=1 Tax=Halobacillus sp. A5 TaxID=2880263 RepID=UPI0020A6BAE1|nr:SEC-C metal-binding domain-containing protein [Halobacillus sp. A5]MCP3028037.1 SEC-C domain-containing protein [Halobacillus sp. A5]